MTRKLEEYNIHILLRLKTDKLKTFRQRDIIAENFGRIIAMLFYPALLSDCEHSPSGTISRLVPFASDNVVVSTNDFAQIFLQKFRALHL